jgi:membrane-bound lytic murein transglycosylase D
MRMEQIAKACGISVEEIKSFNPQYKTTFIPGGRRRSTIALPIDLTVRFAGIEDSIYQGTLAPVTYTANDDSTTTVTNEPTEQEDIATAPEANTYASTSSHKYEQSKNSHRYSKSHERKKRGSRSREVTIQQGDNLSKIAKRNHTTVAELKRKNKIKGDRIRAGQKIRVK